jgi:hypothetical protein
MFLIWNSVPELSLTTMCSTHISFSVETVYLTEYEAILNNMLLVLILTNGDRDFSISLTYLHLNKLFYFSLIAI